MELPGSFSGNGHKARKFTKKNEKNEKPKKHRKKVFFLKKAFFSFF